MPPPLIKGRYGEPIITRIYNNLPVDRTQNGGFGRNEHQLHFHNAHNGAESDGAANVHHFPGTFYDYRWSTTLARRDKINTDGTILTTGGPDDSTGINPVPGDYREYQGTMWAHDHRFFFTAENVYKGMLMMINYYSAKDRGNEALVDGTNLRLPSGKLAGLGQHGLRRQSDHVGWDARSGWAVLLRHLYHRRHDRRPAAGQLQLRPVHGGAAAEVPLPHPQRLHVAVLPVRHCRSHRRGRAVLVHRQRRQPGRQPDHAHRASISRASPSATTSSSTSPGSASATNCTSSIS